MGSVPNSYIDDIRRIVKVELNQLTHLRARWLNGVEKINDAEWSDVNYGVTVCTSTTRPTTYDGRPIYETDTDTFLIYNGAAWIDISGGAAADHGALSGLADDDHTQYLLIDGTREMTGTLDMGANNVYLDSGILRMSDGTTVSGSIGFTTGVQNYIQRQLVSGSDYTLLSDQDYMHTWAILGTEKMHLSTADGLKMYTKLDMNNTNIEGVGNLYPKTDGANNFGSSSLLWNLVYTQRILGNSTDSLACDFRGDAAHKIWYNGTTNNDLEYLTYDEHIFKVGTSPGVTKFGISSTKISAPLDNGVANIYYTPTSPPLITHSAVNLASLYVKNDSGSNTFDWVIVGEVGSTGTTVGKDKVAVYGGAVARTGCNHNMFGSNFLSRVVSDAGASASAIACEFNIEIDRPGNWGAGVVATTGTTTGGSTNTAAIVINKGAGSTIGWGWGILFSDSNGVGVSGTLIHSSYASSTRGIDFSNTTFTDYTLYLKGFRVQPDGDIEFNKTDPSIIFDTNDHLVYDKTGNTLNIVIASTTEFYFGATECSFGGNHLTNLGVVVFNTASPSLTFDTNDTFSYDKTNNVYNFGIGGYVEMAVSASTIDARSKKIVNVYTPTASNDAANKNYVDGVMLEHIGDYH